MDSTGKLKQLLDIIARVAAGEYSNTIMELTTQATPEPIRTIAEAMGMMMVKVEGREFQLEQMVEQLTLLNEQIRINTIQTVAAMAQALEARDAYTRGHAERVGQIAAAIAKEMDFNAERIELVRTAGLLHDLGKIGCSDRIFQHHEHVPSSELMQEIMTHPTTGAEILSRLDFLDDVRTIIWCHHERVDGQGYPRALPAEKIPLEALVIAVADAFDAMTTDRPYQKARTYDQAMDILRQGAGTAWDIQCVAAFERAMATKTQLHLPDRF
ncbi:hypothetical protein MASR1M90_15790 [Desulfovibrionales bacterium]